MVVELLLPVAFGMLGSGMGYYLARQRERARWRVLAKADSLTEAGRYPEAILQLESALAGTNNPSFRAAAQFRLAGLYTRVGNWRSGAQIARRWLDATPATTEPQERHEMLWYLTRCLNAQGETADALATAAEADSLIEKIEDTAYRLFARQERLVRLGRFRDALVLQEELLAQNRERLGSAPTLLLMTAATAYNAGYPETASAYLHEALQQKELIPLLLREAYALAGPIHEAVGEWDEATRLTERSVRLCESLRDRDRLSAARRRLARLHLLQGRLDELTPLLEGDPSDEAALLTFNAALHTQRFDLAAATLERCTALTAWDRAMLEATLALERGDGASALLALDSVVPSDNIPLACWRRRRARRLYAQALVGDETAARTELDALTIEPGDDARTRTTLSEFRIRTQLHLGDFAPALAGIEARLAEKPAPLFATLLNAWAATCRAALETINGD